MEAATTETGPTRRLSADLPAFTALTIWDDRQGLHHPGFVLPAVAQVSATARRVTPVVTPDVFSAATSGMIFG